MSKSQKDLAKRLKPALEELAALISGTATGDGEVEVRPGLFVNRQSASGMPTHGVAPPSFCVIAQGRKIVWLGSSRFEYDPASYLITSLDLPLSGELSDVSVDHPYLGLRLVLDPAIVTSVLVESNAKVTETPLEASSIGVGDLDADLLDATVRLMRLAEDQEAYAFLAPLVVKEIVYRLSRKSQAQQLSRITPIDGPTRRIGQVTELIRRRFTEKLTIEVLSHEVHMSPSVLHSRFKAATSMSPIQFQKLLRLQEARRLMLSEDVDAGQAAARVGYNDSSQFSRDYKRRFGRPPKTDADHVRRALRDRGSGRDGR